MRSTLITIFTCSTLILAMQLFASCATTKTMAEAQSVGGSGPYNPPSYEERINAYSDGETEYLGLYSNFEYKATLLNATVQNALIERQAELYMWSPEKRESETSKLRQSAATETTVFLSFFTPDRKNDNLTDTKSIWNLYLEAGGRRYQGQVKKIKSPLAEIQSLYPYHTRWNSSYSVTFAVPTTAIENQTTKFTITGPLGTRTVTFNSIH